uniref:GRAM domain containing 4 n=1 Tax=Paramormyrops kingsleyae TaxID=1676925 RepID=A0A3B3SZD3_9TELE|nr:GRAM domain-containing protein 4-like isoform X2 [Paramormyrops kingsleyae]
MKLRHDLREGLDVSHVKLKQREPVLTMLKRLDKIRFRGHKRDEFLDLAESPNASDSECNDDTQMRPRPSARDAEEQRDPAGSGVATAGGMQDFHRSESDRLNEVKGHLEIALLEKHFLQEELRKVREETSVETLKQELEKERTKRLDLEQKMNEVLKSRVEDSPPQPPRKPVSPATNGTASARGGLKAVCSTFSWQQHVHDSQSYSKCGELKKDKQGRELYSRLYQWLYDKLAIYIEDFRFQPEENTVETEEPLSAKRLTENMRRLKRGARPVTSFLRNLSALSNWHSVYTSAIAFIMYMNAAWHGWVIPMFLFLAILRLSLNYLIARGWRIQWSIVPEISEPEEPTKEDLTVSEKFQLVLDVAQKAQNLFGKMAGILEKIKNLFMWVQPEMTRKLYIALWVAFISSCVLPFKLLGFIIALYAGIKFFIIDFFFKSCPKLRDKYDTPYIIWTSLLTEPQLKERASAAMSRRIQPVVSRSNQVTNPQYGIARDEEGGRAHSTKKGPFHEIFNLPENERPLPVCENGWRCCLINRDRKIPTDYIRNGLLYVTENYMCFESSSSRSSSSKKNKVIKLSDITDIQKYKVLSVLPGSGMGISIATPSTQKPLVFGAMAHRDEAFEAIFTQYMKIITASNPET